MSMQGRSVPLAGLVVVVAVAAGVAGAAYRDHRIYMIMVEAFQFGGQTTGYGDGYGASHHLGDLVRAVRRPPAASVSGGAPAHRGVSSTRFRTSRRWA